MRLTLNQLLFRTSQAKDEVLLPVLTELGLGRGQPRILTYLLDHESGTQNEIANYFEVDPASVSRMVETLRKNGFVTRTAIEDCRRSNKLELTDKGKSTAEIWREKYRALESKLLAGFSEEEKHQLEELLQRVLDNARKEASQIIENAKIEAEKLKQTAYVEASEKGYNEGFDRGEKDGLNKINSELTQKIQHFEEFIELVMKSKNNIYKEAQEELLEFVVTIAEKLTCDKLKENKNLLLNLITEASSELKEKENLTITVHPSMARNLYSITDELKKRILSLKNIKILEDKMLAEDGLIIETEESRIDASFRTRVEEILKALKKEAQTTRIIPDNLEILE